MSTLWTRPVRRPAWIVCGLLLLLACCLSMPFARKAEASYYRMVLCGANSGSGGFGTNTNTVSSGNPQGIFQFVNACGPAPYPAGNNAWMRIVENQLNGSAANGAFARATWTSSPWVAIAAAGGYTRMPDTFNDGWRGVFWLEGFDGSRHNVLMQGRGVGNGSLGGIGWEPTSSFGSHLWPFASYGQYFRLNFEMLCVRGAGCDRVGYNAVDANSFQLVLNDVSPAAVMLTGAGNPMMQGAWVKGQHPVTWDVADHGSGLRWERMRIDGSQRFQIDHRAGCDLDSHQATGEFARTFQPCPVGGPYHHSTVLNTATLPDGRHTLQVCVQDYGQAAGLSGSGGETCQQRSIATDNEPPAPPVDLEIDTSNPERYVQRFGAHWSSPPDGGSPVRRAHYEIIDASGAVVIPRQTITRDGISSIPAIDGPPAPGEYYLRLQVEDEVGFTSPAVTAPIPRDVKPPAAPQDLSVAAPTSSRAAEGFDVKWLNLVDQGSPIERVQYQVLSPTTDEPVVATTELRADNPQAIPNLEAPRGRGEYILKLWLIDAEGNVGAPTKAPLSYHCTRSAVSGATAVRAALGPKARRVVTVPQGRGSQIQGRLLQTATGLSGASVCVFSRVVTDEASRFLGVATTNRNGQFAFPVRPGASRELTVRYRGDHREVQATTTLKSRVRPTFKVRDATVRNGKAAHFYVSVPGPHRDEVVVVLQVKTGKGWRAFRRCRTRDGGTCEVLYRFTKTFEPTEYLMRAQVRYQSGYPRAQGNSARLKVKVRP